MKLITVTEKSGAKITYQVEDVSQLDFKALGHGEPEKQELNESGNPTGVIIPAEYTIEIEDITAKYQLRECISKRVAEYPTPEEFLNAFFDGGQAALDALQAKRLAVKAKYPKP